MNFPHPLMHIPRAYGARVAGEVPRDAEGFPRSSAPSETSFQGWLQPSAQQKRITETNAARTASESENEGLAFSSHVLFAPISMRAVMRKNDRIRREPQDGFYYVLASDPQDAAGRGHHVEVDLVEFRYGDAA